MKKSITITPKKLKGSVTVPPSKSMAHRAIISAFLADGVSIIKNVDYSKDIMATLQALKAMGLKYSVTGSTLEIKGSAGLIRISDRIDCLESGSTLRFLIPVSMLSEDKKRFIGSNSLGKRPLDVYYEIFDGQNISYSFKKDALELDITGRLKPGIFKVRGDISSQFITGLMFALPLLEEDSEIIITTKLESKSYLDLTLKALEDFGITVINENHERFIIPGCQKYSSREYTVEGDYSQAAFFLSANYLGSSIKVNGLDENSLQGDREIIRWLDVLKNSDEKVIDASNCPDIVPILTVCAALTEGRTKIINAGRLRIKESDRLSAITQEMNSLGADITEHEDWLEINGVDSLKEGTVDSHNDHRIAMSLAVAATRAKGPVTITDPYSINKSYPSFYEDYKKLGGKLDECNMG